MHAYRVMEMAKRWHQAETRIARPSCSDWKWSHYEDQQAERKNRKTQHFTTMETILEEFWSHEHEPYRQLLHEFQDGPAEDQKESSETQLVMLQA